MCVCWPALQGWQWLGEERVCVVRGRGRGYSQRTLSGGNEAWTQCQAAGRKEGERALLLAQLPVSDLCVCVCVYVCAVSTAE